MAMPEEIKVLGKKIDCEISEEDFISGFKGWRESTSNSPSGSHLGDYKAIATDPDLKIKKPEDLHLRECETNLLRCSSSYSIWTPKRWCTSIMVMIKKDPGSPRIKRLQVIHLFEADYNLSLKLLWGKRMVGRG
jgi:hypothetical protein